MSHTCNQDDVRVSLAAIAGKRLQREVIKRLLQVNLLLIPRPNVVNLYLLDDWLIPDSVGDPTKGRLLVDEIWSQPRNPADAHRIRMFFSTIHSHGFDMLSIS